MKKIMGLFVSIVLSTGLLAGCAGAPAENSSTSTPQSMPAAGETKAQEASGDAEAAVWPRTYVDGTGAEVVIEKQPERVAVLHFGLMEYLFVLETPPVASGLAEEIRSEFVTLHPYGAYDVADLGEVMTPNLEKLLEVQPDLILADTRVEADIVESMQKIAPTILLGELGDEQYAALNTYAYILGKEEKAKEFIAKSDAAIAAAKEQLAPYQDKTFAIVRTWGGKNFGTSGTALSEYYDTETGLGLKAPEKYPEQWENMSLEGLIEMNPDYLFLNADQEGFAAALEENENSSVWNSIEAVKNGHVFFLDLSINTGGPLAIEYGIRTIVESVVSE